MVINLVFFINSILLGVGLAMDAFSVSLANGLAERDMRKGRMCVMAGTFGFFQALMPIIGWTCVHTLLQYFKVFEKFIPWIALVLLLYIGGKMLFESIKSIRSGRDGEEVTAGRLTPAVLVVQGIATSIDALSVGFAISEYGLAQALICCGDNSPGNLHYLHGRFVSWKAGGNQVFQKGRYSGRLHTDLYRI